MATTALAGTTAPGVYSQTGAPMTMTAADVANGNHIVSTKKVLIVCENTDGSTAYTVTITSVADTITGRTGSVSAQSLAAGEIRTFLLTSNGWSSNDQYLISANNASIKIGWMLI